MTKVFIVAEVSDVVTTFIGITFVPNVIEGNPLFPDPATGLVVKIAVTVFIAYMLEIFGGITRWFWVIPIGAFLVVPWNIFVIVYSLFWL
jgi:hypothetical protein